MVRLNTLQTLKMAAEYSLIPGFDSDEFAGQHTRATQALTPSMVMSVLFVKQREDRTLSLAVGVSLKLRMH